MMSLSQTHPPFVLKGWHVLAALLAFFGADIAVNAYFMITAYRTFPGETSVTPYEDGLAYDDTLNQLHAQEALGWRISAGAADPAHLRVQASDRAGAPLRGLGVSGELLRPATESGRKAMAFKETAPGIYAAAAGPLSGAWDLHLTLIDAHGRKALAERRLVLP